MHTIDTAKNLASEKRGAHQQRERTRARVLEIAKAEGGMSSGLYAVLVWLQAEDCGEGDVDKPTIAPERQNKGSS